LQTARRQCRLACALAGERDLTIKGQEILTADKVAIRVSILVQFLVTDAKYLSENYFVGRNSFRPSGLKSALRQNHGVDLGQVLRL
jgi:regulator of protease activity HflC (stomatin/prohibitin superfamily)